MTDPLCTELDELRELLGEDYQTLGENEVLIASFPVFVRYSSV
jgi:hypothetical protein